MKYRMTHDELAAEVRRLKKVLLGEAKMWDTRAREFRVVGVPESAARATEHAVWLRKQLRDL